MVKKNRDMTINDAIKVCPATLPVFNTFGIDSCCSGARTLEQAANEGGIDLDALSNALKEVAA